MGRIDNKEFAAMAISSVGASPSIAAPVAVSSDNGGASTPAPADAQNGADNAPPLPPVQAATAPGTGAKVDLIV